MHRWAAELVGKSGVLMVSYEFNPDGTLSMANDPLVDMSNGEVLFVLTASLTHLLRSAPVGGLAKAEIVDYIIREISAAAGMEIAEVRLVGQSKDVS